MRWGRLDYYALLLLLLKFFLGWRGWFWCERGSFGVYCFVELIEASAWICLSYFFLVFYMWGCDFGLGFYPLEKGIMEKMVDRIPFACLVSKSKSIGFCCMSEMNWRGCKSLLWLSWFKWGSSWLGYPNYDY